MPSWSDYKGMTVVESAAELGGQHLTDNYKYLADTIIQETFDARLTAQSGVPVSSSSQTSQFLYLTPFRGNQIALYNTSSTPNYWALHTLSEISLFKGQLPGIDAFKNYDIFVYDDSGTLKLDFAFWTNATTRATALAEVDEVPVKSGSTTHRYVGTIRGAAGVDRFVDTDSQRFIWNYYNPAPRRLFWNDLATSYTQTTGAWRQANNNSNAKVEIVIGIDKYSPVEMWIFAVSNNTSTNERAVGVGLNTTTASNAKVWGGIGSVATNTFTPTKAFYFDRPSARYHTLNWVEFMQAVGTTTWFGAQSTASIERGYGMQGWVLA